MGLFLLRYHSAWDLAHTKPGYPIPIQEELLAADACWNAKDVTDALQHQRSGIEILSCIADPQSRNP